MGFNILLPLRVVQGIFSIIVLGLSGYVAHWYHVETMTYSPSQVNFLIFVPLWSLLSIAYLAIVPAVAPRASHPYAALAFEFTNIVFWFAGFVALAVLLSHLIFCRGMVCMAARADAVFGAFSFVLWVATISLTARDVFKLGLRRPSQTGIVGPPMKETGF